MANNKIVHQIGRTFFLGRRSILIFGLLSDSFFNLSSRLNSLGFFPVSKTAPQFLNYEDVIFRSFSIFGENCILLN